MSTRNGGASRQNTSRPGMPAKPTTNPFDTMFDDEDDEAYEWWDEEEENTTDKAF
jgi:hypothetical protein